KLVEDESLILVKGSVPGSKNGIVFLKDAIKNNVNDMAPFPAGLLNNIKNSEKKKSSSDDVVVDTDITSD
mgnify:CR=1